MEHRLDIDGLRGIAVLSVLLCHAGFSPFSGGFIGVDVFFVISGYVITSSFLRQENDSLLHRFSVSDFYTKRALRLLPALYLVLILTLIGGWFFDPPPEYVELASYVAATLLFIANLYYGNIMGYFGPEADTMPLLHTWSLSVEEQFYLIFPFIFRFFRKYISLFVIIALILSFVYSCVVADAGGDWAFFHLLPVFGKFLWVLLPH
jgi:peptidoglycan/LPS O-acetylase OafA/YrhL